MLSINTNLSSLIAQNSMNKSTNALNLAIERMTTGFKINHAKDNAANYSISTNMQTQIQSYDVAADNVAMGMDLVTTASDIISNMQDKANRLQSLCIQARNGTYGASSMQAINSEASAIMAEINRLYSTAEYNSISLFNRKTYEIADHLPKAGASGFIDETGIDLAELKARNDGFLENPVTYTDEEIAVMLANNEIKALDNSVTSFTSGQKYLISDKAGLERLADLVNSGKDSSGAIFILGDDIDLGGEEWTPIGDYSTSTSYQFKGKFDGNGHVIKNLTIDNPSKSYQGLFGYTTSSSEIKNVGLVNCNVKGQDSVGGLVGSAPSFSSSSISNSYATGNVTGTSSVGGLVGSASSSSISNSYAMGVVNGTYAVGGLVGFSSSSISNSYATGNVTGTSSVGGLVGSASSSSISNSYATGNVSGESEIGGLAGSSYSSSISNSYATGNVSGESEIGGLVGFASYSSSISNSYAAGNIIGTNNVGGLLGKASCIDENIEITDSISYSSVNGDSAVGTLVGGVVGVRQDIWNYGDGDEGVDEYSDGELLLDNCSAIANNDFVGGYFTEIRYDIYYEDPDTGAIIENYDTLYELDTTFDLSVYDADITAVDLKNVLTKLQVGINSDSSCQIGFDTNFDFDLSAIESDISSDSALACINDFLAILSEKATALGAVENRLNSALESITVNIENLTSSLSTIRDADIAEVSSTYIQQQILQQASATLMATANQSPAIALQLI